MKENILFTVAGVALGFFIGFFIANSGASQPPAAAGASQARPLDPTEANAPLPPGHPGVDGSGSAAASSAQAQSAMDTADRNPQDFNAQLKAAAVFYQLQSLDKAELYLKRALDLKPDDMDALTGMAHTKYDKGVFTEAATYYEKILRKQPRDADLLADYGSTFARREPPDYDRAIAEYRKALEVDPGHEQSLARLADVAMRKGDKTTARETIEKLAAVNPSNAMLPTLRSNLNAQ
jgi:tetratricopeptide (TPR) repeat protein